MSSLRQGKKKGRWCLRRYTRRFHKQTKDGERSEKQAGRILQRKRDASLLDKRSAMQSSSDDPLALYCPGD